MLDDASQRGTDALCLLVGLCTVYATMATGRAASPAPALALPRKLTPRQASALHPVSVRWIYERGEELGFASRIPGSRKVVVDEAALLRVLSGRRP